MTTFFILDGSLTESGSQNPWAILPVTCIYAAPCSILRDRETLSLWAMTGASSWCLKAQSR